MAGVSLKCGDCGTLLRSVEEAQEHADLTSHSNFSESTEAVLNLVCSSCGKPCRSKTDSDLHTKRTGHTEFVDKTADAAKPISLEVPKTTPSGSEEAVCASSHAPEEMVVLEVDKKLLEELEGMGFSTARATRALHYSGTNWSLIEDVALCTSWVEVTHSSLTGNEMQLREMWSLIHTNYLEKIGGKRTKESMSSRWKLLSQSFSTWRDALAQASNNIRSGENYSDMELQAQAWYAAKTKGKNKSFNRWECWNIVKDCPKFRVVPVGPEVHMNSTPLHSTPDHVHEDDAEEVPETPLPEQASGSTRFSIRPQGKKATKRKGSASKNDYAKFMEELTRQGELTLARELAKDEADKADKASKAAAVEREFYANERERELLRQEREHVREERRAQQ